MTHRGKSEEESLLSSQALRVLRILTMTEDFTTISALCRKANLNHPSAERILSRLKRMGVVLERRVGRSRMFRVNYEDERISLFRKLATSGF